MQGYLIQSGLSYLTDPKFIYHYLWKGKDWVLDRADRFRCAQVTSAQFDYDNYYFFGALMYIFNVKPKGTKDFNQARHTDGIRMCSTLVRHCNVPTETQLLLANTTLHQSYNRNHPQGLLGFLHDLEDTYATLAHLGREYAQTWIHLTPGKSNSVMKILNS